MPSRRLRAGYTNDASNELPGDFLSKQLRSEFRFQIQRFRDSVELPILKAVAAPGNRLLSRSRNYEISTVDVQ